MRRMRRLVVSWLVLGAAVAAGEEAPRPLERVVAELRATQVTLTLDRGPHRARFQATVIAKREGEVTVLTAAHCLSARRQYEGCRRGSRQCAG